jgi:hypothetical protein
MIRICWVHLVAFISLYSKLIGWVIEGMKYAAAGGDQAFLVVVFFGVYEPLSGVLISSILLYKCSS